MARSANSFMVLWIFLYKKNLELPVINKIKYVPKTGSIHQYHARYPILDTLRMEGESMDT
jgi:hypothetical protein